MIGWLRSASPSLLCRRFRLFITVCISLSVVVVLLVTISKVMKKLSEDEQKGMPQENMCSHGQRAAWLRQWNITRNHRDLLDDRFTIVLSTSRRPQGLQYALENLLGDKIPSLLEIVVIWNNLTEELPEPPPSLHGVQVRYRAAPRNSLNEKLWNDPLYRTRAVLLSDADVFYRPADLEYVFEVWRRFGRDRVTGALAHCIGMSPTGQWQYDTCHDGDMYALVLAKSAFVDVSILDVYNSAHGEVQEMREYVDKHFKCEDIALNFAAAARVTAPDSTAMSVGGPLLVHGSKQYISLGSSVGRVQQREYLEARSECLNDFANIFGCMPLVGEAARIEYGVKHNV